MGVTIQGLLQEHFAALTATRRLSRDMWNAAVRLRDCRTAAMGVHVKRCPGQPRLVRLRTTRAVTAAAKSVAALNASAGCSVGRRAYCLVRITMSCSRSPTNY